MYNKYMIYLIEKACSAGPDTTVSVRPDNIHVDMTNMTRHAAKKWAGKSCLFLGLMRAQLRVPLEVLDAIVPCW